MEKVTDSPKPTEGKETIQHKLTYDPEYIKDRERIDALSRTMLNQIAQLNKHLKMIQITDFSYKISEPKVEADKAKSWKSKRRKWAKFFGL